jgi:6-phosphofructokinase
MAEAPDISAINAQNGTQRNKFVCRFVGRAASFALGESGREALPLAAVIYSSAATMDARLGDVIDDFCVKCRRLTNHSVVSLLNGAAAKVRCRTCYSDHDYRNEQAPPSKKDLKKAELFNAVLSGVPPPPAASEETAAGTESKKAGKKPGKRAEA